MAKFLRYVLLTGLLCALILTGAFLWITLYPKGVFSNTYQSVIQDKVAYDKSLTGKKIVITGGSNCAYGIDEKLLSEKTGYSVANLGLYAGLGDLFQTELVKANLQEGDIVLLAYEYNWPESSSFTDILSDTVMSGIDDDIELYRYVPLRNWSQILGYLGDYAKDKKEHEQNPGEDHHHTLFDADGRMIQERPSCIMGDFVEGESYYNPVDLSGVTISDETVSYLKKFKAYVESKGASVYMIGVPLWDEAAVSDPSTFQELKDEEEEKIGIDFISDPAEYLYPKDLMYDTVYHCNSEGARVRTLQLVSDLQAAGVLSR